MGVFMAALPVQERFQEIITSRPNFRRTTPSGDRVLSVPSEKV